MQSPFLIAPNHAGLRANSRPAWPTDTYPLAAMEAKSLKIQPRREETAGDSLANRVHLYCRLTRRYRAQNELDSSTFEIAETTSNTR